MKTSVKYFHLAVGPRSGTSSQKWLKTYLMTSLTKKRNPKPKNCFSLQSRRLAKSVEGFEQLSSAIG